MAEVKASGSRIPQKDQESLMEARKVCLVGFAHEAAAESVRDCVLEDDVGLQKGRRLNPRPKKTGAEEGDQKARPTKLVTEVEGCLVRFLNLSARVSNRSHPKG